MGTQIDQGGSQFNGNNTANGGSIQQGNITNYNNNNIKQTADKCLADLRVTDPRHDKQRIQEMKGGLLEDSYFWVLENPDFCQWRDNEDQRLLWVKGDPGKGKTMLLCGIIDHLKKSPLDGWVSSYFFCQATDERINTATSVLRGLIFMLLDQNASLVSHLKNKYDTAGEALFKDTNSWHALSEIFEGILQDTNLQGVCLVVDALDECIQGLPELLDLIVKTSQTTHTKWLVSSRNWTEIGRKLCTVAHNLSLELNARSISAAVEKYINFKVSKLEGYEEDTANVVRHYLLTNAKDTFLWVSLVCQKLRNLEQRHAQNALKLFPPGLDSLYGRMMEYVSDSNDTKACHEILALVSTVYRPVSVDELKGLTQSVEDIKKLSQKEVLEVIAACGSFLTLRGNTVYFVHQSAKDFLLEKASDKILRYGIQDQHSKIFANSLDLLGTLKRDIYKLRKAGYPIDQVKIPSPDPLASIRYSCVYWVDHLQDVGAVHKTPVLTSILRFLKTNYLQWLEALSLIHSIPEGVKAIQKLERVLANNHSEELRSLAKDARRFLLSQKGGIEIAPLQTFSAEGRGRLGCLPANARGHSAFVYSVAFSADGRRLASGSGDKTVKLWDAESGACLQTLEGHSDAVNSVALSADGRRLASGSGDKTVKLWDAESGACLQTLEGHSGSVNSVAFSADGRRLASGSGDKTVKLWDAESSACLQTLKGHSSVVRSVAFSPDGRRLASGSDDKTVKLWNAELGDCL